MPRSEKRLDAFTQAYIEAALWSSTDNSNDQGGDPLDKNYSASDIAPETMDLIVEDCTDFQKRFGQLIADEPEVRGEGQWSRNELAGHDFWLTREGHGAGFWDGDWPENGDELTKAAKSYGGFDLYVGDDGEIYGPPADWYRSHRKGGKTNEAIPRPHLRASSLRHTTVRDFNTLDDLIAHAQEQDGATHVIVLGKNATLFYPTGKYWNTDKPQYEAGKVWQQGGYWHSVAPSKRTPLSGGLPGGTKTIEAYLGKRAPLGHRVRDYIAVDHRGRPLSGPTKDYSAAKREADQAGGFVKFTTNPPGKLSEAWGRNTLSDWQILDAIGKGQQVPPEAEARAVKLAQLGFIDTRGAWQLTAKGRRAIEQRVPVAAEAPRRRRSKPGRTLLPMTSDGAMQLAATLSEQVNGSKPKLIPGGFRWSEKNEAAQFTTYSPEYQQKVVCVVGIFEDGSAAITFFSDEGLSGIDTYENISSFTYADTGTEEMFKDIYWVLKTVDGYAASWQQDQPEVDEARRPRARRPNRAPPKRRRSTHR